MTSSCDDCTFWIGGAFANCGPPSAWHPGLEGRSAGGPGCDRFPGATLPDSRRQCTLCRWASLVSRLRRGSHHCSFAYSALASSRMGMSESAPFQRVKKSWYAAFAFAESPDSA